MTQRGLLEGRDLPAALALAQAAEPPQKASEGEGGSPTPVRFSAG